MREYGLILKLLLTNTYRREKVDRKQRASDIRRGVVVAAVLVLIIYSVSSVVNYLARLFAVDDRQFELLSAIISFSQLLILFFGVQATISTVYMARDIEFLQQLPVSSKTLFLVKLTYVYITEVVIGAVTLLPMLFAFSSGLGEVEVAVPFTYYVAIPFIVLLSPMIPLMLVNLLSIPVMYGIRLLKDRPLAKLITVLVIFSGVIALLLYNPHPIKTYNDFADTMERIILAVSKAFPYNRWQAQSILQISFWKHFGLYSACWLGSTAIVFFGISRVYFWALNAFSVSGGDSAERKAPYVARSVQATLLYRESKLLFGDLTFAFISLLSVLITPLMIILINVVPTGDTLFAFGDEWLMNSVTGRLINMCMFLVYMLMSMCGMNFTALFAVTREGQTFYVNKYLPVDTVQILKAKLKLANIISLCGCALILLCSVALLDFAFWEHLLLGAFIVIMSLAANDYGVHRDLKKPYLDWTSANDVTKKSFYPIMPVFYSVGLGILVMLWAFLAGSTSRALGDVGAEMLFWSVLIACAVALKILFNYRLKHDGVRLFDAIVAG